MKSNVSANEGLFKTHKSYTPGDIFAAGGATAFGVKMDKNNETLIHALESSPTPEPFTQEEWDDLMSDLENDK